MYKEWESRFNNKNERIMIIKKWVTRQLGNIGWDFQQLQGKLMNSSTGRGSEVYWKMLENLFLNKTAWTVQIEDRVTKAEHGNIHCNYNTGV